VGSRLHYIKITYVTIVGFKTSRVKDRPVIGCLNRRVYAAPSILSLRREAHTLFTL